MKRECDATEFLTLVHVFNVWRMFIRLGTQLYDWNRIIYCRLFCNHDGTVKGAFVMSMTKTEGHGLVGRGVSAKLIRFIVEDKYVLVPCYRFCLFSRGSVEPRISTVVVASIITWTHSRNQDPRGKIQDPRTKRQRQDSLSKTDHKHIFYNTNSHGEY